MKDNAKRTVPGKPAKGKIARASQRIEREFTPEEREKWQRSVEEEMQGKSENIARAHRRRLAMQEDSLSGAFRRAIVRCGLRTTQVAKQAEVPFDDLADFMAGDGRLTSESLDRIADVLRRQESKTIAEMHETRTAEASAIFEAIGDTKNGARSLSEQLRQAIEASGMTHYRIAQEAGISTSMVDHFVRNERSLHLDSVDKIAAVLGLTLAPAENDKS